jgi:hypothetical protein
VLADGLPNLLISKAIASAHMYPNAWAGENYNVPYDAPRRSLFVHHVCLRVGHTLAKQG